MSQSPSLCVGVFCAIPKTFAIGCSHFSSRILIHRENPQCRSIAEPPWWNTCCVSSTLPFLWVLLFGGRRDSDCKFFFLVTVGWSSRFRSWDLVSRRPEFFPHSDQSYSSWECAGMWETAATTTPSAMWQMCLFFPQQNLVQPQVITQSAYLLIAAGAFVFIVSFLGYCGAVKESRVLLGLVGISLLFLIDDLYMTHPLLCSTAPSFWWSWPWKLPQEVWQRLTNRR